MCDVTGPCDLDGSTSQLISSVWCCAGHIAVSAIGTHVSAVVSTHAVTDLTMILL